jgi:chemotaxis signal transduction protein
VEALLIPVGDAQHALPLAAVRETLPLGPVAPLPGAPPAVLGAVNVRGDVLVLLDTGLLLGGAPLHAPTHAAVAGGRHGTAALAATAQPVTAVVESSALLAVDELLDPERVAAAGC